MWNTLHSFYTSPEWAKLKDILLLERGDICQCGCGERFKGVWDCIPHHKVELTLQNVNDRAISLNPDNLLLVRHACHNRLHSRFDSTYQKVYLVWGAPLAGKTFFVEDAAQPDDLIVDVSRVWDCLCMGGKEGRPNRIRSDVFYLRDTLIERIATRAGYWRSAWIVGSYPLIGERERISNRLSAEKIFINTSREICEKRAGKDQRYLKWVKEFFDRLQV